MQNMWLFLFQPWSLITFLQKRDLTDLSPLFRPQERSYHICSTNMCALQTTPCEPLFVLPEKLPGTLCFSSKAQLCTDMAETAPNCACPLLTCVLVLFMCVCSRCFHASHKQCSYFILFLARGMTMEIVCHFPALNR